jgi:hypothetical protein
MRLAETTTLERMSTDAICRTVELLGEGNPLERGLIAAVITGRSPLDARARGPYPSR